MIHAYLDVNVYFDYILKRPMFYREASQLFELAYRKEIKLSTNVHTLVFAFFHLRKLYPGKEARELKDSLLATVSLIDVVALSSEGLEAALRRDSPLDLEDAGQLENAIRCGANVIVTRDEGFDSKELRVMSPGKFLKYYATQQ